MIISCRCRYFILSLMVFVALSITARASDTKADKPKADTTKYTLRYKFTPDQTLRWEVVDRKRIQATYGGKTQMTEAVSRSTKCWKVIEVDSRGNAVFEYSMPDVDTRGKLPGQKEVRYNSKKDKNPPPAYRDMAKRVGVPLARIKIDNRGQTLEYTQLLTGAAEKKSPKLTIPLPEKPVAIGESWRERDKVFLPLETGATKTILTQQVFTLKDVKTGVATIDVTNQILTPIHSPKIEAKLIQKFSHATIRFDIDAGRVINQQNDLDHRVVGFSGDASCLHYLTRLTERLLPEETNVAARVDEPAKK